ncbi:metallophosphoesterase family protein [Rhodobacter sp. Har01]|uniref:metallophosphoesterase family protein n=1 Tax=Rhodobacter sp. Har01 TaxID=2883999 RepID=UPI001D0896E1|nr:metallophosphoesterase family protein [Rhodobacter sp. Har01]MCB6177128.1 metallophosphoesterase family protein [Rhodobacter sp. Har01]
MKFAILTDIHANREAFEAVLADAAARKVDRIVLLGDLVGYGADPEWCAEKAADLVAQGALCVRGNHDNAAAGAPEMMSTYAKRAMDWTKTRMTEAHRRFLAGLPLTVDVDDILFVHASANEPEAWTYVTSDTKATPSFRVTKSRLIFCGHVHVPLLASCDVGGVVRQQTFRPGFPIPLLRSRRWLAVVGSVGQPRDGVPQAAWALLDTTLNDLTFRRVPYDAATAARKVRAAGLPEELAIRLLKGQ